MKKEIFELIRNNTPPRYAVYGVSNNSEKVILGTTSGNGEVAITCSEKMVPSNLLNFLVRIEDRRFYSHRGIDFRGIGRAIFRDVRALSLKEGGSTLTQQLVRNVLHMSQKKFSRKIVESVIAVLVELRLSKREILAAYLNSVYWGRNLYGLRAASLHYFQKEPDCLSIKENLVLLTLIRGPNRYLNNKILLKERYSLLTIKLKNENFIRAKKAKKLLKSNIVVQENRLEFIGEKAAKITARSIDERSFTILTSINEDLQKKVSKYIERQPYPTSLLIFEKGGLIAVNSTYGTDYPLSFRSNVGSTLKPFLYVIFRSLGIDLNQKFSTRCLYHENWNVREIIRPKHDFSTLGTALTESYNNVFVNAAFEVGIDRVKQELIKAINIKETDFQTASILGAIQNGLTLHDLAKAYIRFFYSQGSELKTECLSILEGAARKKFGYHANTAFLKTGTTNNSREKFAITGTASRLFAFLRQDDTGMAASKDGVFLESVLSFLNEIGQKRYTWVT